MSESKIFGSSLLGLPLAFVSCLGLIGSFSNELSLASRKKSKKEEEKAVL